MKNMNVLDDKNTFQYVFVILTYRSSEDLTECLQSIKEKFANYKAVIVNSFYDDKTQESIFSIGLDFNCECISVENRGYGYGNNRGIQFCKENYNFEYLVVCNPDIVVLKNELNSSDFPEGKCVIAPIIKTANGKEQNPYWASDNKVCEYLIYKGYKNRNLVVLYFAIAVNKVIRCISNKIFTLSKHHRKKVYACHGSFVIYSAEVLDELCPLYDEKMFLFAEEAYTARMFKNRNIPVIYTKDISILHKEDGSMNIAKLDTTSEARKSVIYYYEKLQ